MLTHRKEYDYVKDLTKYMRIFRKPLVITSTTMLIQRANRHVFAHTNSQPSYRQGCARRCCIPPLLTAVGSCTSTLIHCRAAGNCRREGVGSVSMRAIASETQRAVRIGSNGMRKRETNGMETCTFGTLDKAK